MAVLALAPSLTRSGSSLSRSGGLGTLTPSPPPPLPLAPVSPRRLLNGLCVGGGYSGVSSVGLGSSGASICGDRGHERFDFRVASPLVSASSGLKCEIGVGSGGARGAVNNSSGFDLAVTVPPRSPRSPRPILGTRLLEIPADADRSPKSPRQTRTALVTEQCAEHERLAVQAAELRQERRKHLAEAEEREERLLRQSRELTDSEWACDRLDEVARKLRWQIYNADFRFTETAHSQDAMRSRADALRDYRGRCQQATTTLRHRLEGLLSEAGEVARSRSEMERRTLDGGAELLRVQEGINRTTAELRSANDDHRSAVEAMEQDLIAGRRRVENELNEALAVVAEVGDVDSTDAELTELRAELAALDDQLVAANLQTQSERAAAESHAKDAEARVARLAADLRSRSSEAQGCVGTRDALEIARIDGEVCSRRLDRLRVTEVSSREALLAKSQQTRVEEQAAAKAAADVEQLQEHYGRLVTEIDARQAHVRIEADLCRQGLGEDIQRARETVLAASQRVQAVRDQLMDLGRIGEAMQVAHEQAEVDAVRLEAEYSENDQQLIKLTRKLQVVEAEHNVLLQQGKAAAAAGQARLEAAERERRNLRLEIDRLEQEQAGKAETTAAEATHRSSSERRLQQDLSSAEQVWRVTRNALEARNAKLAQQVVSLDGERRDAESRLQELQESLASLVAVEQKNTAESRREHESEVSRVHADAACDAAKTRSAVLLFEELRAERDRLAQRVKRAETLNSGLRAQVAVLKRGPANG
eukprot:TRINITY_DN77890_c0_g1_i1.p1 TRINITY_DN77890_c0_g1~~TRINITY_DN77890_c0_g1_i1.p1  ORF type:complete len:771 (+),score=162.95 TRINITY_DN77890_c0_g1_i1:24-2315(+)